jgi:hypothetical protein
VKAGFAAPCSGELQFYHPVNASHSRTTSQLKPLAPELLTIKSRTLKSSQSRVTRLGEFSHVGWLLTTASFKKLASSAYFWATFFRGTGYVLIFTKKGLATFLIINSSGHPVSEGKPSSKICRNFFDIFHSRFFVSAAIKCVPSFGPIQSKKILLANCGTLFWNSCHKNKKHLNILFHPTNREGASGKNRFSFEQKSKKKQVGQN